MKMRKTDRLCFQQQPFINGYAAYYENNRVVLLQMYKEDGNDFTTMRNTAINEYLKGHRRPVSIRNYAW